MPYSSDENDSSDHSDNESVHSEHSDTENKNKNLSTNDNISDSEISVNNDSSSETTSTKKKLSSLDVFSSYQEKLSDYQDLMTTFQDAEKTFDQQKKNYLADKKKMEKEMNTIFQKLSKKMTNEQGKRKKKTGNSNGGFCKSGPVPKKLVNYLGIDENIEMTRPQITKLLNAKFKEDNFKTDDGTKKTVINKSKAAKQLGVQKGHTIEWRKLQTFIAIYYNEEKANNSNC